MNETVELGEKGKVGSFKGNKKGDSAEKEMYKYLRRIPETSRTALFVKYDVSMFQRFTGKPHKNQEFDVVLVFGELRKWLTIEVKAGDGKKWIGQLKKGYKFCTEVLAELAAAGLDITDWEHISVGAFLNAETVNEVNYY